MEQDPIEYALSKFPDTRQNKITREEAALIVEKLNNMSINLPCSLGEEFHAGWQAAIETAAMFLRFQDFHL